MGSPIKDQDLTTLGISIGRDVWIGAGARILDGVTIADHTVVASGAVVNKSILAPPGVIIGGVPARAISTRRVM